MTEKKSKKAKLRELGAYTAWLCADLAVGALIGFTIGVFIMGRR